MIDRFSLAREHQVGGLDVAVDHAPAVRVVQTIRHVGHELGHGVEPLPASGGGVRQARRGLILRRRHGPLRPKLRHGLRDGRFHQRVRARVDHVAQHVVERLPVDQVHGVEVVAVVLADGVDRNDVGVVQLGRGLRLALEALLGLGAHAQCRRENLEGHAALE